VARPGDLKAVEADEIDWPSTAIDEVAPRTLAVSPSTEVEMLLIPVEHRRGRHGLDLGPLRHSDPPPRRSRGACGIKPKVWLALWGIALVLAGCGTVRRSAAVKSAPTTTVAWYYTGPDGLTYNRPNPNPSPRDQVDWRTCTYVDGHTVSSEALTCRSSSLIVGPAGNPDAPGTQNPTSSTHQPAGTAAAAKAP